MSIDMGSVPNTITLYVWHTVMTKFKIFFCSKVMDYVVLGYIFIIFELKAQERRE